VLSEILQTLFSPVLWIAGLTLAGVLFRDWRMSLTAAFTLLILSLPIVTDALHGWVQEGARRLDPVNVATADAVVVLGGAMSLVPGEKAPVAEWGEAIDRGFGGAELMLKDKAPIIIVSGGLWMTDPSQPNEGELLRTLLIDLNVPPERILVTPTSGNTEGEAVKVRRVLRGASPHIILVTSAFHLPRARLIFEAHGFDVTGYPVDFRTPVPRRFLARIIPSAAGLAKTDLVIREVLGRIYYRMEYAIFPPVESVIASRSAQHRG
jgi:uncharacterized SAM-binding protein YcdF (DUF218 family)